MCDCGNTCKRVVITERGEPGPQGLQGLQGLQGEKGDKGDKGDTGSTGSSSIWSLDTTSSNHILGPLPINEGFIMRNSGFATLILPSIAPIGSTIKIVGTDEATGNWKIKMKDAGQTVQMSTSSSSLKTTAGTGSVIPVNPIPGVGEVRPNHYADCLDLIMIDNGAGLNWVINSGVYDSLPVFT
jgi:hypothetical protein